MNVIIDNFDFWNMEAQKYYSTPSSWSPEKKKENATNKIFSSDWWGVLRLQQTEHKQRVCKQD